MSVAEPPREPSFASPELRRELARLREVDNVTNLGYLAFEYLCLAGVIGSAVAFAEYRASWGLAWAWDVPVFALAMVLVGGLQHRLAGLGHEAAHYTLLKNKWANDFVGDLFCLVPILSTIHFYRLFHLAHHQYVNDPAFDPDIVNLGPGKRVDDFPMPRWRITLTRLLAPLTSPASFARFQLEYIYVTALGKGGNVYMRRVEGGDADDPRPRVGTLLGLAYLLGFVLLQNVLMRAGLEWWLVPAGLAGMGLVATVSYVLPGRLAYRSPFRQPYSPRVSGVVRLGFFTALLVAMGLLYGATGGASSKYVYLLWFIPLMTTFPYFLLLRDTFQHINADDGRLTNTRVFFCDPFTRWAVFVYGQDMHLPHHLFPAVPHYRLRRLHRALKRWSADYAREAVECRGLVVGSGGSPSILDVLSKA